MIHADSTVGVRFVLSARQAYDRWSSDGGLSFSGVASVSGTSFSLLCSGQAYAPHTFGADRGFVDQLYLTGEEVTGGRLFAFDSVNRDLYQLSSSGTIGTSGTAALSSPKLEDIDTSPSDPSRVVLGDQDSGVFTFDFQLVFAGAFAAGVAGFSVTKISDRSDSDDAAVSAGSLGQFASHTAELCSAGRRTTAKIAIPYPDRYYLVVPIGAAQEGSYVTDSVGVERPAGITSCRLQQVESPARNRPAHALARVLPLAGCGACGQGRGSSHHRQRVEPSEDAILLSGLLSA